MMPLSRVILKSFSVEEIFRTVTSSIFAFSGNIFCMAFGIGISFKGGFAEISEAGTVTIFSPSLLSEVPEGHEEGFPESLIIA